VELIGKRWSGAIIRAMRSGRVRFSDISDAVPGLHDRLLSERLKELEHECIVERVVIPETPVRIDANSVRGEKVKVLRSFRPIPPFHPHPSPPH